MGRAPTPTAACATRTGHRERLLLLPAARELLVTASYVRAERLGPVDRVVVALRDTERRRRAERDHAELISTVAHELRSPLTTVKGFTATLLRRVGPVHRRAEAAHARRRSTPTPTG